MLECRNSFSMSLINQSPLIKLKKWPGAYEGGLAGAPILVHIINSLKSHFCPLLKKFH